MADTASQDRKSGGPAESQAVALPVTGRRFWTPHLHCVRVSCVWQDASPQLTYSSLSTTAKTVGHTRTHTDPHTLKKKHTHSNVQSCTSSDSQLHPSETSSHSAAPRHGHKTNYADWHFGTSLCEDKQRRVPSQRRVAITAAPTRSKGVHLPLRLQKVQR